MYTSLPKRSVNYSDMYRWCARVSSTFIMLTWLALFIAETMRQGLDGPSVNTYGQAAALAIVFAGYVLAWWKELAGALLSLVGTITLFAVVALTQDTPLEPAAIWFAAPGLLYVLASTYTDRHSKQLNL